MTRARRSPDWELDLDRGREDEGEFRRALQSFGIALVQDSTSAFNAMDFLVNVRGRPRWIDVKGKWSDYSHEIRALWPEVPPAELFVIDETAFRRVVWLGSAGYMAVHDHRARRWVFLGPWELTLSESRRYQRRGHLHAAFLKGKLLLDLRCSAWQSAKTPDIQVLLDLFVATDAALRQIQSVRFPNESPVPILGDFTTQLQLLKPTDESLFESLRRWRRQVSARERIPAFAVFHDRHLRAIAHRRPLSMGELALCPGVGPARLDKYGEDILRVIGEHLGEAGQGGR